MGCTLEDLELAAELEEWPPLAVIPEEGTDVVAVKLEYRLAPVGMRPRVSEIARPEPADADLCAAAELKKNVWACLPRSRSVS